MKCFLYSHYKGFLYFKHLYRIKIKYLIAFSTFIVILYPLLAKAPGVKAPVFAYAITIEVELVLFLA